MIYLQDCGLTRSHVQDELFAESNYSVLLEGLFEDMKTWL